MDYVQEFLKQCLCLDTESTGLDPINDEICELGLYRYIENNDYTPTSILYGTTEPIPFSATACNNITRRMIDGKPKFVDSISTINKLLALDKYPYIICHNVRYDRLILESHFKRVDNNLEFAKDNKFICTMRLAKQLHKPTSLEDTLSYSLSYLRYFLNANVPDEFGTHRAQDDAYVCGKILEKLVEEIYQMFKDEINSVDDLGNIVYQLSSAPIVYEELPIGKKYKGMKIREIAEIDAQYLIWCMDTIHTLKEDNINYDEDLATSILNALEDSLED